MTGLVIGAFEHELEILEVYWLAGFYHQTEPGWQIRVVMRGVDSGRFWVRSLPIGMYPMLTLGTHFEDGQLLHFHTRGVMGVANISNVADGEEVCSDQLPSRLYSFGEHRCGIQHLLRYDTEQGVIFIPMAELVRFLFVHNKTMANALMQPGSLMVLHQQQLLEPGAPLHLNFSMDIPLRLLSQKFIQEFAWLAYDKSARLSWDSVYANSIGKPFVSFTPPDIPDSTWSFRGVECEGMWLVLELMHITGRGLPSKVISYSHPSLVHRPPSVTNNKFKGGPGRHTNHGSGRYKISDGDGGARTNQDQPAIPISAKGGGFVLPAEVTKVWQSSKPTTRSMEKPEVTDAISVFPKETSTTVTPQKLAGRVLPIELTLLEPVSWEELGSLEPMARMLKIMSTLLPTVGLAMTLCKLPSGRAFSIVERKPRVCLVAILKPHEKRTLFLLDVDRAGGHAISTLVVQLIRPMSGPALELLIWKVLEQVVRNNGHWCAEMTDEFSEYFLFRRFPRIFHRRNRGLSNQYLRVRAVRLCGRFKKDHLL